jgi:hypothetical protein
MSKVAKMVRKEWKGLLGFLLLWGAGVMPKDVVLRGMQLSR